MWMQMTQDSQTPERNEVAHLFLDSGLFFVIRVAIVLLGVGVFAAVGWNYEASRIISAIEQVSAKNKVVRLSTYEGTYIVGMSSPDGIQIEFFFSDAIQTLAASSTRVQVKKIAGSKPKCEPLDIKIRYQEFLAFVDYAKITPYHKSVHDFASLMSNFDQALKFMNEYYGPNENSAKQVNFNGIEFRCYLGPV